MGWPESEGADTLLQEVTGTGRGSAADLQKVRDSARNTKMWDPGTLKNGLSKLGSMTQNRLPSPTL